MNSKKSGIDSNSGKQNFRCGSSEIQLISDLIFKKKLTPKKTSRDSQNREFYLQSDDRFLLSNNLLLTINTLIYYAVERSIVNRLETFVMPFFGSKCEHKTKVMYLQVFKKFQSVAERLPFILCYVERQIS